MFCLVGEGDITLAAMKRILDFAASATDVRANNEDIKDEEEEDDGDGDGDGDDDGCFQENLT